MRKFVDFAGMSVIWFGYMRRCPIHEKKRKSKNIVIGPKKKRKLTVMYSGMTHLVAPFFFLPLIT